MRQLIFYLILIILLSGCQQPTGQVILQDENQVAELIKYVCWDGSVVENKSECPIITREIQYMCPDGSKAGDERDCPVACPDYCDGNTLLSDGEFRDGQCIYESVGNAVACGFDPCFNVTCQSYCSGDNWYYDGSCLNGNCIYEADRNSFFCRYKFQVDYQGCSYMGDYIYALYFKIKNIGAAPTEKGEGIWLVGPGLNDWNMKVLSNPYSKNRFLWDERKPLPGLDMLDGVYWLITGVDLSKTYSYKLLYCKSGLEKFKDSCIEGESGFAIYDGNVAYLDCGED